jgi:hypothetical protein
MEVKKEITKETSGGSKIFIVTPEKSQTKTVFGSVL